MDDLYLALSSDSDQRAASVLPAEGTEDARRLLRPISVQPEEPDETKAAFQSLASEWVVHATPKRSLEPDEVLGLYQ